jgi:hypothetical protein
VANTRPVVDLFAGALDPSNNPSSRVRWAALHPLPPSPHHQQQHAAVRGASGAPPTTTVPPCMHACVVHAYNITITIAIISE